MQSMASSPPVLYFLWLAQSQLNLGATASFQVFEMSRPSGILMIQAGRWRKVLLAGSSGSGKSRGSQLDIFIDSDHCHEADGSTHRLRSWSFLAALAQAIWIMIDFLNDRNLLYE